MGFFRDAYGINWPNILGFVFLALFIVSIVGEVLHWWSEVGELLATAASVLTLVSFYTGAGRHQATRLGAEVRGFRYDAREDAASLQRGQAEQTDMLRDLKGGTAEQTDMLREIKGGQAEQTDTLHDIKDGLTEQTGTLRDIRDALRGNRGTP